MLDDLGSSIRGALKKITGRVSEEEIEEVVKEVQRALLEADVDVTLVKQVSESVKERSLKEEREGENPRERVLRVVYEELVDLLGKEPTDIELERQVILLSGLQGSGKTTTAAKLANWFSRKGIESAIVQTDTHRPGAYEQAKELAEKAGIEFYGEHDSSPEEIAKRGVEKFQDERAVIVDTAGRHSLEEEMIEEIESIEKTIDPDINFLVLDASLGQGAKKQAQTFNDSIGVDGVIITKLDGTAKGGGTLAAVSETNSSIGFVGTGERVEDFERFDPEGFVSRLLGMGDLEALAKRAEEAVDEEDMEMDPEDILKGDLTLKDVYEQLDTVQNMGPLEQIFDMLPLGGLKDELPEIDEAEEKLDDYKVIMDSMTEKELENPRSIGASQIERISRGSGKSKEEVRELLEQHRKMEQAMNQMKGREGEIQKMAEKMGMNNLPF